MNEYGENNGFSLPTLKKLMVPPVRAHHARGLAEALKLMQRRHVDSLVVVDNHDRFLGIASVWDVSKRYKEEELTLKDIMDSAVETLQLDDSSEEAFQLVRESKYGFVPVLNQGKIEGIVTRASLVDHIADTIGAGNEV